MFRRSFYSRWALFLALLTSVAFSSGQPLAAQKPEYQPEALVDLVERVQAVSAEGNTPVVIFDLDDTLINTRERSFRILKDFVSQGEVKSRFPEEAAKMGGLRLSEVKYLLNETLAGIGITTAEFVSEANAFWLRTFFTDDYCAQDRANRGAVNYTNLLFRAGATIVYLTGRDIPRMEKGTRFNLHSLGFPLDDENARLVMKPTKEGDDLAFKLSELDAISELGEVVGQFENEPANINAIHERLPNALSIFVDTIHSLKPDVPESGIPWVSNFRLP